jgi:hypothetical protein
LRRLKKHFRSNHFIEEKKEEFQAENPNSTEDFQYHSLKVKLTKIILNTEIIKRTFKEFTI